MKTDFKHRIKQAVEDDALRTALSKATTTLRSKRLSALESLPDSDLTRKQARSAKQEVLNNFAYYAESFEQRLLDHGVTVCWAENAESANQHILEIAQRHQVKTVVKSKSMATEETNLNEALEQAKLKVVETDLGEYIVQLAKDRPSHIILPIVHMSRQRVGEVMHDTLGLPYTDDPAELCKHARTKLRSEFLAADMGISGANFGVAETGGICLVTNEGNARLCTSLPRVHVVLMGIEKIVPTMQDLDQVLKVLARSATGQKISTYTTLIHGAAKDGAVGPEHMYVILLDNGRSTLFDSPHADVLACIRCGACLNVCPIYKNIGGHAYGDVYPGPIGSVVTPYIRKQGHWKQLAHACTLCEACHEACPVRIDLPKMLLQLRANNQREEASFIDEMKFKMFANLASCPVLYKFATKCFRSFMNIFHADTWLRKSIFVPKQWTKHRDFKTPASQSFQDWWRERSKDV